MKYVNSTDEVYGELDFDPTSFFTEQTLIQPNSPYSASNAASDLLVYITEPIWKIAG